MTAGDILHIGPFNISDADAIRDSSTGISGAAVVADDITATVAGQGQQVYFTIIKAA